MEREEKKKRIEMIHNWQQRSSAVMLTYVFSTVLSPSTYMDAVFILIIPFSFGLFYSFWIIR